MFELFRRRRDASDTAASPVLVSPLPDFLVTRSIADVVEILRLSAREIAGADGITIVERSGDCVHYMTEDAVAPLWAGQRFLLQPASPAWRCLPGHRS